MKVVLVGSKGQLGRCLQDVFPSDWWTFCFSSSDLDISNEADIQKIFDIQPDIIINASAYTKVDLAETETAQAFAVNATGVYYLAEMAKKCNAKFIHVSTDYVFDGSKGAPYTEVDVTCPLNIYGQSKLSGEILALATHVDTLILRTSWVFSEYGNNFLKTMLRLGEYRTHLNIVGDQIGAPTYAGDLAKAIIHLVKHYKEFRGILNVAGRDVCSWAEFAEEIFRTMANIDPNYAVPNVAYITTEEYPVVADRPRYSVLDTTQCQYLDLSISSLSKNIQLCLTSLR